MMARKINPLDDNPIEVTIADGHAWAEVVLDDMENANWHTAREAFAHTIHILPQIYETLELFGYNRLAKKLLKSTEQWEKYF
jgi:hypothetical protein